MGIINNGICSNTECDKKGAYAYDNGAGGLGLLCNEHAKEFEPDGTAWWDVHEKQGWNEPAKIIGETGIVEPECDLTVHDEWKDKGDGEEDRK